MDLRGTLRNLATLHVTNQTRDFVNKPKLPFMSRSSSCKLANGAKVIEIELMILTAHYSVFISS